MHLVAEFFLLPLSLPELPKSTHCLTKIVEYIRLLDFHIRRQGRLQILQMKIT